MRWRNGRVEARPIELLVALGIIVAVSLQSRQLLMLDDYNSFSHRVHAANGPSILNHHFDNGGDWFNETKWRSAPATNGCYFVEDVCHSTMTWFYNDKAPNTDIHRTKPPYQPPLSTKIQANMNLRNVISFSGSGPHGIQGYPEQIEILSSPPFGLDVGNQCIYSPITNHMVLHSFFNDMLGEFYVRLLMGYWDIVAHVLSDGDEHKRKTMLQHTQLYILMHYGVRIKTLLESQHLFLDVANSNPLLPFSVLMETSSCRCLRRLLLCGYHEVNVDNEEQADNRSPANNRSSDTLPLEPFQYVGSTNYANLGPTSEAFLTAFHDMKTALRLNLIENNPLLQDKINEHRKKQIEKMTRQKFPKNQSFGEYKVVGLVQRNKRRRWLNIQESQQRCNKKFRDSKVICVVVNIELDEYSNTIGHAVSYAGLDMLIGIHGAQLTEALFMKPDSWVVELLPWIPVEDRQGQWTRAVHEPTPLGTIFKETDLNHIGYQLRRDSVSTTCEKEQHAITELFECLERKGEDCPSKQQIESKFLSCLKQRDNRWSNRDFSAKPSLVLEVIEKFVLNDRERSSSSLGCQQAQDLGANDFVLYNVNCIENGEKTVQHFYREKEWADEHVKLWDRTPVV